MGGEERLGQPCVRVGEVGLEPSPLGIGLNPVLGYQLAGELLYVSRRLKPYRVRLQQKLAYWICRLGAR